MPVLLSGLAAAVILGVGFPASALLSQHRQLSTVSAQLAAVEHQNALLNEQQHQLGSNVEIARIARADYQLVPAGQTLFDILPPAGGSVASTQAGTYAGDPGTQPLVAPAHAPSMSPDAGFPGTGTGSTAKGSAGQGTGNAASGGSTPSAPTSFWSRITDTLEFWK